LVLFNALFPEIREVRILRMKGPYVLDPPYPPSLMIQDKKAPAPVVAADLGPGQVDRAIRFLAARLVPEERARVGEF